MAKSPRKCEFHPCVVFSTRALLRDGLHIKCEFAVSSNNKDQIRDLLFIDSSIQLRDLLLLNYLNQKVISDINTLDGSTLGDSLITSNQVDYMPSVLIPAEAVENDQEHLVAIRSVVHVISLGTL